MKIVAIHGIGNHEAVPGWENVWPALIKPHLGEEAENVEVISFAYDDLFAEAELDEGVVLKSLVELSSSGVSNAVLDFFGWKRSRGSWSPKIRWTAGMVAQWAALPELRAKLRQKLQAEIEESDAKVIIGHSLGSLIAYDLFSNQDTRSMLEKRLLVTLGSQIGNPAVRKAFANRITTLAGPWINLYNRYDRVFVTPIRPSGNGSYLQLETDFDAPGPMDHDADGYLAHDASREVLWPTIRQLAGRRSRVSPVTALNTVAMRGIVPVEEVKFPGVIIPQIGSSQKERPPRRRAALVAIDQYLDPKHNLAGCVNDAFELSAVLQESGFEPENIRALFDQNATAAGILDRLDWLLDDARPGDTLIFSFSGHGARVTPRGVDGSPQPHVECLVPADVQWTPETLVADHQLLQLYADLPYDVNLIFFLDCCHAGGVWREGASKVRGLNPPDDLRHESLRWDKAEQMWVQREADALDPSNEKFIEDLAWKAATVGLEGNVVKLGRAYGDRASREEFNQLRETKGHQGPFTPVVFQACRDDQLASEYRHGNTSYGVFTYALTRALRKRMSTGRKDNLRLLMEEVKEQLKRLNYSQNPEIYGPTQKLEADVSLLFD